MASALSPVKAACTYSRFETSSKFCLRVMESAISFEISYAQLFSKQLGPMNEKSTIFWAFGCETDMEDLQ
jgi:hypothetical protein